MSDENNAAFAAPAVTEIPISGRGMKAFVEGSTLHLQVDLTGEPKESASGKTDVLANGSLRGLIVPGFNKALGGSFSVYVKK